MATLTLSGSIEAKLKAYDAKLLHDSLKDVKQWFKANKVPEKC